MLRTESKILNRYRQIAVLLFEYGGRDLVSRSGLGDMLDGPKDEGSGDGGTSTPEQLADDLESLGPTFVKLGQLLSTRTDLLPAAYCEALSRLQDDVEPVPFEEIERTIETSLGVHVAGTFRRLDPVPLASASLAQVHRAVLNDGSEVVVKVQRPNIREDVLLDLEAVSRVARFLCRHSDTARRFQLDSTVDQFRETMLRELDYEREAENLRRFGRSLKRFGRIVVPQPIDELVSTRVLVMDHIDGTALKDLSDGERSGLPGHELATELFRAYLHQILIDGTFHADPHPGNVLLTHDRRIALIDLGMVGNFEPRMQTQLIKLLLALSEGRGSETADLALAISPDTEQGDEAEFRRRIEALVADFDQRSMADLYLGSLLMKVRGISAECGVMVPPGLAVLAKTMMHLDAIGRSLSPDFDPSAAVREYSVELLRLHVQEHVSNGSNLISGLLDTKELIQSLPRRANQILTHLAENNLRVSVDAVDEDRLLDGIEKIANRITAGLVLAALIVGAALLMRVQTPFTILGYPGLAMLFFLLAAGGGFVLLGKILGGGNARRNS